MIKEGGNLNKGYMNQTCAYPGVDWQSQCDGGQSGWILDGEVRQGPISEQQLLSLATPNRYC